MRMRASGWSRVFAIGGQIRLTRVSRVTRRAHVLKPLGGRCVILLSLPISSSFPLFLFPLLFDPRRTDFSAPPPPPSRRQLLIIASGTGRK